MMKVIIVGGGKVGSALAALLLGAGHVIKLVETRRELLDRLQHQLPAEVVVWGSGTDPNLLPASARLRSSRP
jgi:trk system potassium uptake protein TrkA